MKHAKRQLLTLAGAWLTCAWLMAAPAHATLDPLIDGAKLCTRFLPRYEREYGIPVHLLSAISSTESGRWHTGLKLSLPWPWTINAEGKGYYLNSKAEALAMARKLRAQGVKSMDVGCMQVNLHHHPNAFANLEDAFEPDKNIAYAASFLRALYQEEGNWKKAAAAYHSKTPSRGAEYVSTVYDKWYNIIDKLRLARTVVAAADVPAPASSPVQPRAAQVVRNVAEAPKPRTQLGEQSGKKLAAQEQVRMKVIKVDGEKPSRAKRENGILVLRADTKTPAAKEINLADARSQAALAPAAGKPAQPAAARGPRFIFTD